MRTRISRFRYVAQNTRMEVATEMHFLIICNKRYSEIRRRVKKYSKRISDFLKIILEIRRNSFYKRKRRKTGTPVTTINLGVLNVLHTSVQNVHSWS